MEKEQVKEKESKSGFVKVKALKDFSFVFDKKYEMEKGKEYEVPKELVANLKSEKVIK